MANNPLDTGTALATRNDDPQGIENMPGYIPPKQRKNWTKAEHCKFANDQLAWRGINEARAKEGLDPVKWIVANGIVMCVFADERTRASE